MIQDAMELLIGLGGNIGDVNASINSALACLETEGRITTVSRLWRTHEVGPPQPDYINAAAIVEWPADPRSLLARCLDIETAAGRDRAREERWGPRPLDIDLLIAPSIVCRGAILELPHPRLHQRRFILEPAAEVAPEWHHPLSGRSIAEMLDDARTNEPDAIVEVGDQE